MVITLRVMTFLLSKNAGIQMPGFLLGFYCADYARSEIGEFNSGTHLLNTLNRYFAYCKLPTVNFSSPPHVRQTHFLKQQLFFPRKYRPVESDNASAVIAR